MWIRSPKWDGCWILSGVPLGLALTVLYGFAPESFPLKMLLVMFLANGHALAPIWAAWSNPGFRKRLRAGLWKYAGLPAALILGATAIGISVSIWLPAYRPGFSPDMQVAALMGDWRNPFVPLMTAYVWWNIWHFGKQNFGVLRLYGGGSRRLDLVYACGTTWATMIASMIPALSHTLHDATGWPATPHPFLDYFQDAYLFVALIAGGAMVAHEAVNGSLPRVIFSATLAIGMIAAFWAGLWMFAILLVNHWLVAIGLAGQVCAKGDWRRFATISAGLSLVGAVLFASMFLRPDTTVQLTCWALGFRFGLGFVHFLYDRWIYRFSDPLVTATVGLALFPRRQVTSASFRSGSIAADYRASSGSDAIRSLSGRL
jgi:hypothetical protein